MRMDKYDIYYEAIGRYGKKHQMEKAVEEMSELTKEIIKNLHGAANMGNICEELADVEITLEQLKLILGEAWETYLALKKAEKLGKLAGRLCDDTAPE